MRRALARFVWRVCFVCPDRLVGGPFNPGPGLPPPSPLHNLPASSGEAEHIPHRDDDAFSISTCHAFMGSSRPALPHCFQERRFKRRPDCWLSGREFRLQVQSELSSSWAFRATYSWVDGAVAWIQSVGGPVRVVGSERRQRNRLKRGPEKARRPRHGGDAEGTAGKPIVDLISAWCMQQRRRRASGKRKTSVDYGGEER